MSIGRNIRRAGLFVLAIVVAAPAGVGLAQTTNKGATKSSAPSSGSTIVRPTGAGPASAPKTPIANPVGNALDNQDRPAGVRPAGPRTAAGPNVAPVMPEPRAPEWARLTPEHEKYLNDVLRYWEDSSGRIKRYRCTFKSWEYDGTFVSRTAEGKLPPKTTSNGVIQYEAPDKGMYKVERILVYRAPMKEGERAQYLPPADELRDHWVCDGKSVFEFDHPAKQLKQIVLPKEMQGKAISDGPLPFIFGAEVDKIKQRFWLRIITPKDSQGEYWLEAVPKTRHDASQFKMVHVIIDEKDYLPKAMKVYYLEHDQSRGNEKFTTYTFDNRETNWSQVFSNLNPIHKDFWEPATPLGYKKVVEQPNVAIQDPSKVPPVAPRQAKRPDNKK